MIEALDHVIEAVNCEAALGGGWAVWRHGYIGRVTQDVDVVLPADRVDEFLRVAAGIGIQSLTSPTRPLAEAPTP